MRKESSASLMRRSARCSSPSHKLIEASSWTRMHCFASSTGRLDLRHPLSGRGHLLLIRIELQCRRDARFGLGFLPLLFVELAEPVVGAGQGWLVVLWGVGQVLAQQLFAVGVVRVAEDGKLSEAKDGRHVRSVNLQGGVEFIAGGLPVFLIDVEQAEVEVSAGNL